jgi:hypothetical protein
MIFATFAQILGVSFYGFILGSINAVVESLDKRNASYERKAGQYVSVGDSAYRISSTMLV